MTQTLSDRSLSSALIEELRAELDARKHHRVGPGKVSSTVAHASTEDLLEEIRSRGCEEEAQ